MASSAVYKAAKAKHPERRSGDARKWLLSEKVLLNPEKEEVLDTQVTKVS
jgi:hypothetical protein